MKRSIFLLLSLAWLACNDNTAFQKATDAEEAGREFVRASLDGNYEKAKFYLFQDSMDVNSRLLDKWKSDYDALPTEEKVKFKEASIRPVNIYQTDSSEYFYKYFNSYKNDTTILRIVKVDDRWLVDLANIH